MAGGSGKEGLIKRRKECRERNLTNKDQIEEERRMISRRRG